MKNYYEILDVEPDATQEEIKKKYKALAKVYHPDVSPFSKSEELFRDLQEAYETLSDENKRRQYDNDLENYYDEDEYEEDYDDENEYVHTPSSQYNEGSYSSTYTSVRVLDGITSFGGILFWSIALLLSLIFSEGIFNGGISIKDIDYVYLGIKIAVTCMLIAVCFFLPDFLIMISFIWLVPMLLGVIVSESSEGYETLLFIFIWGAYMGGFYLMVTFFDADDIVKSIVAMILVLGTLYWKELMILLDISLANIFILISVAGLVGSILLTIFVYWDIVYWEEYVYLPQILWGLLCLPLIGGGIMLGAYLIEEYL